MEKNVVAYVPIFRSVRDMETTKSLSLIESAVANLLSAIDVLLRADPHVIGGVSARLATPPKKILAKIKAEDWMAALPQNDYVEIRARVKVDLEALARQNEGKNLPESFLQYCATATVADILADALVLSELAHPGCISTREGVVLAGGEVASILRAKGSFSNLRFAEESKPEWPELKKLDLVQVSHWSKRVGFGKLSFADCRLGRGLAALTHAIKLTQYREGEVLFRAMQGLEAIYCEGTGDLRRQLSDKVKLWLGPWVDQRNIIGHLYDTRSAFVHGSAYIEFADHRRDAYEDDERAKKVSSFATTFAVRLLIRTLQRCVEEGAVEIGWILNLRVQT